MIRRTITLAALGAACLLPGLVPGASASTRADREAVAMAVAEAYSNPSGFTSGICDFPRRGVSRCAVSWTRFNGRVAARFRVTVIVRRDGSFDLREAGTPGPTSTGRNPAHKPTRGRS